VELLRFLERAQNAPAPPAVEQGDHEKPASPEE
jgi:hypothetical protein